MANKELSLITLEVEDIKEFFQQTRDASFVERILQNTARYVDLFCQVCDQVMPKATVNFRETDQTPFEILMDQRRFNVN